MKGGGGVKILFQITVYLLLYPNPFTNPLPDTANKKKEDVRYLLKKKLPQNDYSIMLKCFIKCVNIVCTL